MIWKGLQQKKWFKIIGNLYVLILTIFVIWMLFFDQNSMLIHLELRKEIKKLEEQKDFLRDQINQDKALIESLSNPRELEKFARETYFLKKEDEEIYLIEFQDSINSKSRD
ncbi:MAG: hypothetical protein RLZZ241_1229 [Bacteroidota bacterium]